MKTPHFFCDNCGAEVKRDTKICPQCGRFFASVRCPKCGFTGSEERFILGCPVCGYSAGKVPIVVSPENPRKGPVKEKRWGQTGTLPLWVYIVTALVTIGVFGILIRILK